VELEKHGELAELALRAALQGKPSLEVWTQAKRLLGLIEGKSRSAESLRTIRAIAVLERIGGAQAREVLVALSRGAAGAGTTRAAKAALQRLVRREVRSD
jgi:hypothetical protein